MADYITSLDVSTNYEEEQDLEAKGFQKINVNLNEGTQAGNNIYLWFQTGFGAPITRVQVTFKPEMEAGLKKNHFIKIQKNLNTGTSGEPLYMWYSRATGPHDVPIKDVKVTVNASSETKYMTSRAEIWEEVSCNLNLGAGGNFVYAWVKREKPIFICDVTATSSYTEDHSLLSSGYTRMDVNTNLGADGGADVFIWYRKTTNDSDALSELMVTVSETQPDEPKTKGFEVVDVNLNEGTGSKNEVYLWHKREAGKGKVRGMVLLLKPVEKKKTYESAGVRVIDKNLNDGNSGEAMYLCYV